MRREVTLEEISDGKLYDANDMVKADCQECKGCCDCCKGMGDSVLLDPYDVCRLSRGLQRTPEDLIGNVLELGISDGNILPASCDERSRRTMCVSERRGKMLDSCNPSGILPVVPSRKILF